ncbi:MAG: TonB-dependent receptor [Bacteroidales bacterium]|nr:TonB-dependent receptor [Bacteroidales bacterium]
MKTKWKRFSGASYATFQSLHREVRIGVLSVAMLSSVALKAKAATSVGTMAQPVSYEEAADAGDSLVVGLEDVVVLSSRVPLSQMQAPRQVTVLNAADIAAAAVHSINDLLEYAVGVDVRQRGDLGVQTDISVRGGTFDQISILLNGINISSPHTGHLSADFPVSLQDVERIEVMQGPAARVFGTSAFTGAVNIVTKSLPDSDKSLSGGVHLYGGSYGYAGGDLSVGHNHRDAATGNGYAGRGSLGYSRSDGATPNSYFESTRAFYQGEYQHGETEVALQLGYSYKPYAANTFYGAASTDQWESNERYMGALTAHFMAGQVHIAPSLAWNRWFDHYQWHKDSPMGENYHQVDTRTAAVNSWLQSDWGKTSFGIELRHEAIESTKLGDPMDPSDYRDVRGHDGLTDSTQYTHQYDRTNLSFYLEHNVVLDWWTFSAGLLANMNTGLEDRWGVYPGVDIAWRPNQYWKAYLSWNMALRMPTFTDLYYSGTNIEGNENLKPERTSDVSLGVRMRRPAWRAEASVYYSHKSDMIDWVKYNDDASGTATTGIFHSINFLLDNVGCELTADFLPREVWSATPLRRFSVQYAWIDQHTKYDVQVLASKYAMEYLRHKVVMQADSRLWRQLNLGMAWRWQDRQGEGNDPYGLLECRLSWDASRWSVYAECANLLDKDYYDYSYIPQPGRTFTAGLRVSL